MERLSHSTVKGYLSGIRHLHIEQHLPDLRISSMSRLELVLRGNNILQAKMKEPVSPRLPITPDLLLKIRQVWYNIHHHQDHVMLWAATLLCFFGFLRAGVPSDTAYDEGAHLSFLAVFPSTILRY